MPRNRPRPGALTSRVARVLGVMAVVGAATLVPVSSTAQPAAERPSVMRTVDGQRCTVVGTRGRDVLRGTPGRDVICGLAGSDVIRGNGGNDVIAGGKGGDVIDGGSGDDAIASGPGDDILTGGAGNDTLRGAAGDDDASGDAGDDLVQGQPGDDVLDGGAGDDAVDGGSGFDLCDTPQSPGDTQLRCAIDRAPAVVTTLDASPAIVDVSSSERKVTLRARVTDDTGVKNVFIGPSEGSADPATLMSGTTRDGTWEVTVGVRRFVEPGPVNVRVVVFDRVSRATTDMRDGAYTIVNTNVDYEIPVLTSLTLGADQIDVRTSAEPLTGTAHITDDVSGPEQVLMCAKRVGADTGTCQNLTRTSGTAQDSTWRGAVTIPKGAPSGTWNVFLYIEDVGGRHDWWLGPQLKASDRAGGEAIPGGVGEFEVIGSTPDGNPPDLGSLKLSPSRVDTSLGAVSVTAEIAASDVEGVEFVSLGIGGYPDDGSSDQELVIATGYTFDPIEGTTKQGVWRISIVVPGGTPDGTYFIYVGLQDSGHHESWSSPGSSTGDSHILDGTLAPTGTHFVVANSDG